MIDTMQCSVCGCNTHWRRFRVRNGDGTYQESDTCSTCRTKISNRKSAAVSNAKRKLTKRVVLNRTRHDKSLQENIGHFYPDIEQSIRSYCNRQTAMDRKYLRDVANMKPCANEYLMQKRRTAVERAKGWIAFYDDIAKHSIQLLRATGMRPSIRSMEQSSDAQLLYGLQNTKRARRLRGG